MKQLILGFCILMGSYSHASQCVQLLLVSNTKPLTSAYIAINQSFPLSGDLLSLSLASRILIQEIPSTDEINWPHVHTALNNLHAKYGVKVRVDVGQEKAPEIRYLSPERAQSISEGVIINSFQGLHQEGLLNRTLNPRELSFWNIINKAFQSTKMEAISSAYKNEILRIKEGYTPASFNRLKTTTRTEVINLIYSQLSKELEGGLSESEADLMATSNLFN